MKNLLLFLPALMISSAAFAIDEGQDMTSGVHGNGGNLFPHFNVTPTNGNSNSHSRLVAKTSLFYNGSGFVPLDSTTYSFLPGMGGATTPDAPTVDEKVYFDESYTYKYDKIGGYYINKMHRKQEYTANNEVWKLTYQEWYATSSSWKDSVRYIYDYQNGRMTAISLQTNSGGWVAHGLPSKMIYSGNNLVRVEANFYQMEFAYNAANKLEQTIDKEQVNGVWVYDEKHIYAYDLNGKLQKHVTEQYNVQTNNWQKIKSLEYIYDNNGNIASVTEKQWDGSSFVNKQKNDFTYDANNNKLTDILSEWNGSSFEAKTRESWEYNAVNQVTMITTDTWTSNSWQYTNTDKQFRFYYQVYFPVSVNNVVAANEAMTTYPVPATDNLTVSLKLDKSKEMAFSVVDIKGSTVANWRDNVSGNYNHTIPVSELAPGTYFIKATGQDAVYTQRFIVAR